jgi:hypothetical protein
MKMRQAGLDAKEKGQAARLIARMHASAAGASQHLNLGNLLSSQTQAPEQQTWASDDRYAWIMRPCFLQLQTCSDRACNRADMIKWLLSLSIVVALSLFWSLYDR